ncbi:MAG: hypothetical protein IPK91_14280 [Saprospiraceae bacterium]|jgi:uncharacterized membrane protein|nr:hypothetical protein [Saprospiraceae bacterium]MBK8298414.1 hypothetical protein [Saprospiraceae bacterium]
MNLAHVHLLITHLPVFGSILGAIVLAYGLYTKSTHTISASYLLLIISALGVGISYLTGESAEELVEQIPGVSKNRIHEHEEAALFGLISLIVVGLNAILGLIFNFKNLEKARLIAQIALICSLFSFSVMARVGYLGGQIRHTEIYESATTPSNGENQSDDRE